jgi:hypothetical protein
MPDLIDIGEVAWGRWEDLKLTWDLRHALQITLKNSYFESRQYVTDRL